MGRGPFRPFGRTAAADEPAARLISEAAIFRAGVRRNQAKIRKVELNSKLWFARETRAYSANFSFAGAPSVLDDFWGSAKRGDGSEI
jgi:hypothetical protein